MAEEGREVIESVRRNAFFYGGPFGHSRASLSPGPDHGYEEQEERYVEGFGESGLFGGVPLRREDLKGLPVVKE